MTPSVFPYFSGVPQLAHDGIAISVELAGAA
jgi:hypothetical protein